MPIEIITLIMFGSLIFLLIMGLPIAFAAGGAGIIGLLIAWGPGSAYLIASRTFQNMTSYTLVAVAPFIFMGLVLERSGIGGELFEVLYHWAGRLKGALAIATVLACTAMAAMTGIVGAAVTTMGVLALPAMLKRKYDKSLALGSCCAGGSLGVLIPPSVILIIYGESANISVGKLFMGGFGTGFLLAGLFIIYILVRSQLQPKLAPAISKEELLPLRERVIALRRVILPMLLIILVLGVIFAGLATPTEAAGVGALGAVTCALILRRFSWEMLKSVTFDCAKLTVMVMWIVFGSSFFVAVFAGAGGAKLVEHMLLAGVANPGLVILVIMAILFFLGCFIDSIAIVLLCAPIFTPIVVSLGFDPIWFGIVFNVNLQMAYITPPFGYSLFYLRGVAPSEISTGDIYRSVWPFVGLQLLCLVLCIKFPILAMWLPNLMIK